MRYRVRQKFEFYGKSLLSRSLLCFFITDIFKLFFHRSLLWLAYFLKTLNLTKFRQSKKPERRQKADFLSPRSSKTVTKEKERVKRQSERWRKAQKRKKATVALLVFISISYFAENKCWTQKAHLTVTLSNIRLLIIIIIIITILCR